MSFTVKNLSCFGGDTESGNPKLWKYKVPYNRLLKSYEDITVEDYFDKKCGLSNGDIILAITGEIAFYIYNEILGVAPIKISSVSLPKGLDQGGEMVP